MELKEKLQNQLNSMVGQKVNSTWEADSACYRIMREWAVDNGYGQTDFGTHQEGWTIDLKYKGCYIGRVKIKRQKGQSHWSIFGNSYCDWTYKGFELSLVDNLTEKTVDVDQALMAKETEQEIKKRKGKEIALSIMEKYGVDEYQARELLREAVNACYDI